MHSIVDREYWQTGKPEVWTQAYRNDGHLVHLDKRAMRIKLITLATAILLTSSNFATAGGPVLTRGKPPLNRLFHQLEYHHLGCEARKTLSVKPDRTPIDCYLWHPFEGWHAFRAWAASPR